MCLQVRVLVDAYGDKHLWGHYFFHVFIVSGDFKRMREIQYQSGNVIDYAEDVARL